MRNPSPNDKALDMTKWKHLQTTNQTVLKMTISLIDTVENIVGKEENAGHQHFLLFKHCFLKLSSLGLFKVGIVW